MKRFLPLLMLFLTASAHIAAQDITVSGSVIEKKTNEPVLAATLQLQKVGKDTTFVCGVASNEDGTFKLPAVPAGKYLLRVSYVGFKTIYQTLQLTANKPSHSVGRLLLEGDAILMKEAEITARAAKVEVKEDTFVYSSSAYRIPEGSALEELVKQLPGAEVDDDGTIKVNGKTVKKIMVNGKEFFGSDTKIAMKNVPTNMVEKVKAYDKKSDMARVTGIDDGEEETVLDLSVKKGMNQGWFGNADVGYGTEKRYTGKLMVNRFTDNTQMSLVGSTNNVNDRGFGGGGGGFRGGGGGGLTDSKMAGFNFALTNGKRETENGRFELGGNVRFNHSNRDSQSRSNSQTFLTSSAANSFANSQSHGFSRSTGFNSDFRLEWAPDTMTNIIFRPSFSYSESSSNSASQSVTFNSDPYEKLTDPLSQYASIIGDSTVVNSNNRESMSRSNSRSVDGQLQINRRLNTQGRNITLRLSGGYTYGNSKSFNISDINYYLQRDASGNIRNMYTNQYNRNPSKNYNYSTQLSYSEPLFKGGFLQGSYRFQYRYSDSEREMYSLDSIYTKMADVLGYYDPTYKYPLGYLPGGDTLSIFNTYNTINSQYATYKYYNHNVSLMFRYINKTMQLSAGVTMQPQTTKMSYRKNVLDTVVTRHVFNVSPRIRFRYKFSNVSQLNIRYNGSANQPSMTDLLDVSNTADPLNISRGNPGLKPSWTNDFDLFYNGYITDKQMGWMVHARAQQTSNSISNATFYNEETGGRASIPMNINGNWNAGTDLMFNTAIGEGKYFNVSTFTNLNYSRAVGYISTNGNFEDLSYLTLSSMQPDRSITKTTRVNEHLRGTYRNGIFEVGVNGNINYQHARNDLQENANLDTYTFAYGGNLAANFDFGLKLATDISQNSRRGYDDSSMNTNELIWNAQLSQSFLKSNALTVSVQWYDILRRQSSISRSISATQRSDTWTNGIHSYLMVHLIYKLNLMGNREMRGGWGDGGGGGRGGWGGGRGGGGGGFGGPGRR